MRWPLVAIALVVASPASAQVTEDCSQVVEDQAGDVLGTELLAPGAPSGTEPLDILRAAIWRTDVALVFSGTLAQNPRTRPDLDYAYWFSTEAEHPAAAGNPATWTFQDTKTFDLIDAMYWESDAKYPVTWNGTQFQFAVPWTDFAVQYGSNWPMELGSPRLSSAHYVAVDTPALSTARPTRLQDDATFSTDLVPLPECPASDVASPEPPVPASSNDAPGLTILSCLAAWCAVAVWRPKP